MRQTLPSGPAFIPVSFDAAGLRELGVYGPWRIGPIEIAFIEPTGATPADRLEDAGLTPALSLASLERPRLEFAGSFTDAGVDLDGNGLFDRLEVSLAMSVAAAGFYNWSAILFDSVGRQIGFATGSAFLPAGAASIQLAFGGDAIGTNGIDGPYTIGNLLMNGAGASLILRTVTQTSRFQARQFEGYRPPDQTPPAVTATASPDVLWPPNGRLVPVTISGRMTDDLAGIDEATAVFVVQDEYARIEPSGPVAVGADGRFAFTIDVEARRLGTDRDGRRYRVTVSVVDRAGNAGSAVVNVVVPRDRR